MSERGPKGHGQSPMKWLVLINDGRTVARVEGGYMPLDYAQRWDQAFPDAAPHSVVAASDEPDPE